MASIIRRGIQKLQLSGIRSVIGAIGRREPIAISRAVIRHRQYRRMYGDAAPDPYELIHVDPLTVTHVRVPRFSYTLPTRRVGTYIRSGTWDQQHSEAQKTTPLMKTSPTGEPVLIKFENFVVYESCERHFQNGTNWEETALYEVIQEHDVETGLSDIDALYRAIREDGYLTQRELDEREEVNKAIQSGRLPLEHDEIAVNIGRDGEVILDEGKHRFTVARLLGLESVPCRVMVRHEKWQEKRAEIAGAASVHTLPRELQQYLNHPDMNDVKC